MGQLRLQVIAPPIAMYVLLATLDRSQPLKREDQLRSKKHHDFVANQPIALLHLSNYLDETSHGLVEFLREHVF